MRKVKVINWLENYRGFIGHLSDSDAENWKTVIRSNVPDVVTREVDVAVAELCQQKQESPAIRITAKSIIDKITASRFIKQNGHAPVRAYCTLQLEEGVYTKIEVAELKRWLDKETDPCKAWDLICAPMETDACRALESYAHHHGILFTRFKPSHPYETKIRETARAMKRL